MVGRSKGDAGRICEPIATWNLFTRELILEKWDGVVYAGDEDVWYNL